MSLDASAQLAEQVKVNHLVQNVIYASGAIIAYRKNRLDYFTMGPMAGYVSGPGGLDRLYRGIEADVEPSAETVAAETEQTRAK